MDVLVDLHVLFTQHKSRYKHTHIHLYPIKRATQENMCKNAAPTTITAAYPTPLDAAAPLSG
jgi:hypothetical protein